MFSPIVHMHDVAAHHKMPTDAEYWKSYNKSMLYPARDFILLRNLGWGNSKGLQNERGWSEEWGKPISFLEIMGDKFVRTWE